jgi:hypothetical protein
MLPERHANLFTIRHPVHNHNVRLPNTPPNVFADLHNPSQRPSDHRESLALADRHIQNCETTSPSPEFGDPSHRKWSLESFASQNVQLALNHPLHKYVLRARVRRLLRRSTTCVVIGVDGDGFSESQV